VPGGLAYGTGDFVFFVARSKFVSLTVYGRLRLEWLLVTLRAVVWISRAEVADFDKFLICVAEAREIGDEYKYLIKLHLYYQRALLIPLPSLPYATSKQ
jgi:hypothetical protein